jgi:chromosome segregation ATPase
VPEPRSRQLLDQAAELERRDTSAAAAVERVSSLAAGIDHAHDRARQLLDTLARLPARRDALRAEHEEVTARASAEERELREDERRLAELERRRRRDEETLAQARRDVEHARERLADTHRHGERVLARLAELDEEERAARAEADVVEAEADALANELRELPRVSRSARERPGGGLEGVVEWGARAHAALVVTRSALVREREQIVREAGELGAVVLGEPLAGASVAAVRSRLERALGA